ncbi:dTDP-3-amino-3,4,6-trideoxy-alpha-D-glucose transaminase [Kineococcus xinjiangensis]|uniref:dTDP-3-amino-3,4,6-trideoxy-alpha-D-glucose transaminase n=1 Tax=Kineococcus xinjiangensis TaxID=512762 RepID=A0A2S6IK03_9ACTN|nr:DegT/DnrJ/EryC1/StrS family aminotransferase [Kineococcus xinjiangensis]PPK94505.1 dTDP-3-amino-3,4,6-trideoxy-alpha-D-glucose transaminase [Kineococcus xinjiangensis]
MPEIPFSTLAPTTAEVRAEVEAGWRRILDGGSYVGGVEVDRFEHSFAGFCDRRHAVGVANGTDALHLILRGLGIGPGDEVLVPANTFIATAEAVLLAGARPRFVDVDPRTLLMSAQAAADAVTPATAAVIAVHLYGHVADLGGLREVAHRFGLAFVEDAAQAHGASRDGTAAGAAGVAAAFSFYPGKNLGAFGDGGAVVTDDAALADRVRSLANHGRSEVDRYIHERVGMNSRLDALQAVVLSAKLRHLPAWTAARRTVVDAYREQLRDAPLRLVEPEPGVVSAWHLLVARTSSRDHVRRELAASGIETGIHYPLPCPAQPAFRQWSDGSFPVATAAAAEVLSLPLHPHMTSGDVATVCAGLRAALASEDAGARA